MTAMFGNYRVKTNKSGWLLQKKRGQQWKETEFHSTLGSLVDGLLQQTFNEHTKNLVYYIGDEDEAIFMLETINTKLKAIREEILGVLK